MVPDKTVTIQTNHAAWEKQFYSNHTPTYTLFAVYQEFALELLLDDILHTNGRNPPIIPSEQMSQCISLAG
jgi:hypothetical protein